MIEAVYPQTQVQLCIVHQVYHSLRYLSWKQRKAVASDLRRIYIAATLSEGEQALHAGTKKINRLRNLDYDIREGAIESESYDEFCETLALIDVLLLHEDQVDLAYAPIRSMT